MLSPIVLFVYNRPNHTKKTLESLMKNYLANESSLFIFADGPRKGIGDDQMKKIIMTRKIIREKKWCKQVHIIERENNLGLAKSVISGIGQIINQYGKVIVLEDDLLLSKNFLTYMNNSLDKYDGEKKVMQISGYMYPINISRKNDAIFLPIITSWGWGTWKRVWDKFDAKVHNIDFLSKNKKLQKEFDLEGSYPYYKMLKLQLKNNIDSWAILFYLNVFKNKGLTVFPIRTLVRNIGFDGSGVHCKIEIMQNDLDDSFFVEKYDQIEVSPDEMKKISDFLKKQMKLVNRIKRFINQYLFPYFKS